MFDESISYLIRSQDISNKNSSENKLLSAECLFDLGNAQIEKGDFEKGRNNLL